ncbi:hypothetical protein IWX65_000848 [Arthrobacter sp. CAN_A214]|uniref:DUF6318 family protein n=1 Tax=Arthrobacter sp. CAN_A214 TaxID=2787720 RepID=UPI0018CB35B2
MNLTRTAAIAALSLLALSACGTAAEPESAPEATPSPASSSAAAANIVQPETNELSGKGTAEGARAFLFHYFDLKSYALQTGDTAPMLENLDGADAELDAAKDLEAIYADGGWVLGGQPKVTDVYVTTPDDEVVDGADVTALVTVNPGAYTEFSEGGAVQEQRPFTPGGTTYTAVVVHADGGWTVTSLEETPDAELPQA